MAVGYEDWRRLSYIQEQSLSVYWAYLFRPIFENLIITDKKLLNENADLYCIDSLRIEDPGRLVVLGHIIIMGD